MGTLSKIFFLDHDHAVFYDVAFIRDAGSETCNDPLPFEALSNYDEASL
jgi:hypothetical protein